MTEELKSSIIKDVIAGIPHKEIADKYRLNPSTVGNNIANWKKRGLIPQAESVQAEQKTEPATENHTRQAPKVIAVKTINIADIKKIKRSVDWLSSLVDAVYEHIMPIYGQDSDFEIVNAGLELSGGAKVEFKACGQKLCLNLEVVE